MARSIDLRAGDAPGDATSRARAIGIGLGGVGLTGVAVVAVAGLAASSLVAQPEEAESVTRIAAWTFGLNTLGLSMLKLGIAAVLGAILFRVWRRGEVLGETLRRLVPAHDGPVPVTAGDIDTPSGRATVSPAAPEPLTIHRVARLLWAPMVAMGVMAVAAGFVVSLVWASGEGDTIALASWTQGLQFLGEGMLLGGISFLLGTVLSALRTAGGEVQESLGVAVKTLRMPITAKVFIGLMAIGMMAEIAQFVGYLVVAAGNLDPVAAFAWLGPLREAGLGLLLSGIVLALATIATVLRFGFDRVVELVTTAR
jgi:hypothetical protein